MRLLIVAGLMFFVASCAPVTIEKEITEYKYEGDKLTQTYKEKITQIPEKRLPITLRHAELYE